MYVYVQQMLVLPHLCSLLQHSLCKYHDRGGRTQRWRPDVRNSACLSALVSRRAQSRHVSRDDKPGRSQTGKLITTKASLLE